MDETGKGGGSRKARVQELEAAHKQALVNLLQAIRFRYVLYVKLGSNSEPWKHYAQFIWDMWQKWYARQKALEYSGGMRKENITKDDWLTPEGLKKLEALAKGWDKKGEGVGFIPLLIWAVTAIIGFFSADYIVDELNTTTQEQESLIKTTEDYCTKYKLNAEECKAFMTQQNTAVANPDSGGGIMGTVLKWGLVFGGGYLLFTNLKSKSK